MWALWVYAIAFGQTPKTDLIRLENGLVLGGAIRTGRLPVVQDRVLQQLAKGEIPKPVAGGEQSGWSGQTASWTKAPAADKEGWIESPALAGGYYAATYEAPADGMALLSPQGASSVYVNGRLVAGDPYGWGWVKQPIQLRAGHNDFLFVCGRGSVRPSLELATPGLRVGGDMTYPDLRADQPKPAAVWVSVQLTNASAQAVQLQKVVVGSRAIPFTPKLLPLQTRKLAMRLPVSDETYRLVAKDGQDVSFKIPFRTRKPGETYKVTFRSAIDGSVQYYAVRPALKPDPSNALVLSLHGASVEATGQADSYGPKTWASIVCPTNRRPYGFDWEDWGGLDALEVLDHASASIPHDPSRVSLTGHSMGGHGSWRVATTYPDRFAAVGPSAGWVSFQSYAGGAIFKEPTVAETALQESLLASDTLSRLPNLKGLGIYIIHGDADDNVPVTEARTMRDALTAQGTPFAMHEEKGAGHWWSNQDEPGASCVDWAPLFDLIASRRLPQAGDRRDFEFWTAAPNVSSKFNGLEIVQQAKPFNLSGFKLRYNPNRREWVGSTTNIQTLKLPLAEKGAVVLDGQKLAGLAPEAGQVLLTRSSDAKASWYAVGKIPDSEKNAVRGSGWKLGLRKNFVIVYGTRGTQKENAWMLNKARLDAETWWIRGNGDIETIADADFDPALAEKRDILLLGNEDINGAWKSLLRNSPIQVRPGEVQVGEKKYEGEGFVALFVRPSLGNETCVACVGITGLASSTVADRLPYFTAGIAYPDFTVIGPEAPTLGSKGVVQAGWFDNQWKLRP